MKAIKKPVKKATTKKSIKKVAKKQKETKKVKKAIKRIVKKDKKILNPITSNGAIMMDQDPVNVDPIDTSAKTITDTSTTVINGIVTVEAKTEENSKNPPIEKKATIKVTEDGMVMVEPVIDE
jgi:hypothetical protein